MSRRWHALLSALLALGAVVVPAVLACQENQEEQAESQEAVAPRDPEATIERILELEREAATLLDSLPAEFRAEAKRRLVEQRAAPGATAAATPQPALPQDQPAPEPPAPPALEPQGPATSAAEAAAPSGSDRPRRGRSCNTLLAFDSNTDGALTGVDRYWRHFYLWVDADRDNQIAPDEVERVFHHDIRRIELDLDTYTLDGGGVGDVLLDEVVTLRLLPGRGQEGGRAVLVVDADGLARGQGPTLYDRDGRRLEGLQPFRRGLELDAGNGGARIAFDCP